MRMIFLLAGILLFGAGVAASLLAPGKDAAFSVHMVRHMALLLAAPLIALAIPAVNTVRGQLMALSQLTARFPFLAWLTGMVTLWFLHVPTMCDASAHPDAGILSCAPAAAAFVSGPVAAIAPSPHWVGWMIPLLRDLTLVVAGFLFSWPVVTPYPLFRLAPLRAVFYLASGCVCCMLLGMLITFAPAGRYAGVTTADRQTGGMIMWAPWCLAYLTACIRLVVRWLMERELRFGAT